MQTRSRTRRRLGQGYSRRYHHRPTLDWLEDRQLLSGVDGSAAASSLVDVSDQVRAVSSGLVYNRKTQLFNGSITLTDIGTSDLAGPVEIALKGLPSGVTLVTTSGTTAAGDPFISIAGLTKGQSQTETIQFRDPILVPINYTVQALAPSGIAKVTPTTSVQVLNADGTGATGATITTTTGVNALATIGGLVTGEPLASTDSVHYSLYDYTGTVIQSWDEPVGTSTPIGTLEPGYYSFSATFLPINPGGVDANYNQSQTTQPATFKVAAADGSVPLTSQGANDWTRIDVGFRAHGAIFIEGHLYPAISINQLYFIAPLQPYIIN